MDEFIQQLDTHPIIAAVRTEEDLLKALSSECAAIFLLNGRIDRLAAQATLAHKADKRLFLHLDLAEGIGKDEAGVSYAAGLGIDGIITTRGNIIKAAKECHVLCVQRFFMVDSRSVDTAAESIRSFRPNMVEIMPGIAIKTIKRLQKVTGVPLIAGGLIEDKEDIYRALGAGASAVSIGHPALWSL